MAVEGGGGGGGGGARVAIPSLVSYNNVIHTMTYIF